MFITRLPTSSISYMQPLRGFSFFSPKGNTVDASEWDSAALHAAGIPSSSAVCMSQAALEGTDGKGDSA